MRSLVVLALLLGSAGAAAAHQRATGLPRRVVVVTTAIEIIEPIRFRAQTAVSAPESTRMLDAIAATLVGNPGLTKIEIRVHAATAELAAQRARAIVAQLVARGVTEDRLRPVAVRDAQSPHTEVIIAERASGASVR